MLPGRYRLLGAGIGPGGSQLQGFVDVPNVPVVYIGTLRFAGDLGGGPFVIARGQWSVLNAPDEVVRRFRERYPRVTDPVSSSLMSLGPPRRPDPVTALPAPRV